MDNKKKYYYMPFYPGDWLKDIALNSCSLQTQGAWARLICHMHDSEQYGYLIVNDKPLDRKGIQNLLRVDDTTYDEIWFELTDRGVIKQNKETGAYYSKRMVNDHKKYSVQPVSEEHNITAAGILKYLSKKTKVDWDVNEKENLKDIIFRLNAGYKSADLKKVIDVKCDEWLTEEKMKKYLRPSTLFGNKFTEYLKQEIKNTDIHNPNIIITNPYNNMMKK